MLDWYRLVLCSLNLCLKVAQILLVMETYIFSPCHLYSKKIHHLITTSTQWCRRTWWCSEITHAIMSPIVIALLSPPGVSQDLEFEFRSHPAAALPALNLFSTRDEKLTCDVNYSLIQESSPIPSKKQTSMRNIFSFLVTPCVLCSTGILDSKFY